MRSAIEGFGDQFSYKPTVENAGALRPFHKFIVCGMGGSHLGAGILKARDPYLDIIIHRDYGLPSLSDKELKERLIIASSYSGNTEEVVDALEEARKKGLARAVIATGGKLMEMARAESIPYIQMPDAGIQPRSALGLSVRAMAKMTGEERALAETDTLLETLQPKVFEEAGKKLAEELNGKVPIIYSSARNEPVAYIWKIKFNETGKIHAFCNVVPELNHNEMTGFDAANSSKHLSERFAFILLQDQSDHPRVEKRMNLLEELLGEKGFPVKNIKLQGSSVFEKIFSSILIADWTAFYTAELYGLEPEDIPMVRELKERMKE